MRTAPSLEARADGGLVAAGLRSDGDAFGALVERHRHELEVHCYRMLGSPEDAEDVVQEALLRAWHKREQFQGRSSFRAWLYGIATNCCLDALERRSRRILPPDLGPAADPYADAYGVADLPWLEPYPDRLLDRVVDDKLDPHETAVARETIELVFLAAIQHLPPRQRAALILRDVLEWSARETADALSMSVVASNSALQRARAELKQRMPQRRLEWRATRAAQTEERRLLDRYMEAWTRTDLGALVSLLREDARLVMPPTTAWFDGREAIGAFFAHGPLAADFARVLRVPTRANRQPAFAIFHQRDGAAPEPFAIEVLRIEDGLISEIYCFHQPRLFTAFAITPPV